MSVEQIYLACPTYDGKISTRTHAALSLPSHKYPVSTGLQEASLLSMSFNQLWCTALNNRDQISHFAMIHADIGAPPGWLDILIEELETFQLSVVSAVIPIKNQLGLTSTAVDSEEEWGPHRRLTMSEVDTLPQTFNAAHVGGPLLLNTGLWVCDFRQDWVERFPGFEVRSRVKYQNGTWEEQTLSEDWQFSRFLNSEGVPISATKAVALEHRGFQWYPTHGGTKKQWLDWGTWKTDQTVSGVGIKL